MGRSTTPKIKKKTKKERQCSKRNRTFSSDDNDEYATVLDEKETRPHLCKSSNATDLNGNIPTQIHACGRITGTYVNRSYIPRCLINWILLSANERVSRRTLAKGLSVQGYQSCGNVGKAPTSGYLTAYFTRLSIHQNHKDRGNDHLVHWENGKIYSYIGAGITYHNGKIRVNVSQDYFVYAFVTSHQGIVTDGRNHPGSCLFTMWVFKGPAKYDGEFERIELKSTQMLHNATTGKSTSYTGSHVHLYSNEEIYVKVTDSTRLVHTSSGNGFGIFPLL